MNALQLSTTAISLLAASSASAWDASTTFTSALPADFAPSALATPDAHGFWATGLAVNSPVLVRYDTAGSVQFVRYVPTRFTPDYLSLSAVPDGGVIVEDLETVDILPLFYGGDDHAGEHCVLRRYDAVGNLRWTSDVGAATNYPICDPIAVDGAGGAWIETPALYQAAGNGSQIEIKAGTFYRVGNDGVIDSSMSLDGLSVATLVGDPLGPNVYLVGHRDSANAVDGTVALVQKVSGRGAVLWTSAPAAAPASTGFDAAAAAADGRLYAFGAVSGPGSAPYGVKLSPSGQQLWEHIDSGATTNDVYAMTATPDGEAFVLFDRRTNGASASALMLAKTAANGTFAWTAAAGLQGSDPKELRAAPNGDAVISATRSDDTAQLSRISASGTQVFSTSSPNTVPSATYVLADSSTLQINMHYAALNPDGTVLSGGGITIDHVAADGSALAQPSTAHLVGALDSIGDVAFASDGSAYLLVVDAKNRNYELSRIAPAGQVVWSQQHSGSWDHYGSRHVVLAGDAVCLVGSRDSIDIVDCYGAASGTLEGSAPLDSIAGEPRTHDVRGRALDSGQILVNYIASDSGSETMHRALVTTHGTVLSDTMPFAFGQSPDLISINRSGQSLAATVDASYAGFAADGTRLYTRTASALGTVYQTYLADDGSGLLLTTNGTTTQLSRLDASGVVSWTRAIGQAPPAASTPYNYASAIEVRGNDAYLVLGFRGDSESMRFRSDKDLLRHFPYLIEKVSLADGSVAWSATLDGILFNFPIAHLDTTGQHFVAVSGWSNKIHTQVLGTADGHVLDDRFDGCDADVCTLSGASLGSDGALRAIVDASSNAGGSFQRIFTRNAPLAAGAPIRIDQAGLDGGWFAPYASGQGFTLDYIASAKTLFMPWFTYTADGGNTPGALAWYTLQGTVASGATGADLAIATANPGSFDAGAVGVRQVGSAHLSFSDCTAGTLSYHFNAGVNAGASGLISLTRLTPSSNVCMLANGSTAPAQIADVPVQGFDASQSGSWFDPTTSGQGLEITIVSRTAGSDGFVFAAWFTFDPANHSDDEAHQHWFTLQGSLAGASTGKVSLPILRTIGGSLDAMPTGNTVQVGHSALTIKSCDSAQLDYQFDDNDVAHAFAGLSGSVALTKIGGCAAP